MQASPSPPLSSRSPPATAHAGGFRVDRLRKSTFREHIAARLRSAILAGEIAPGVQLVEATLARQFQVSRGPLREALRELIEEGLLVTVAYTGTHVIALTAQDIHEIHTLRIALERFAFEQAWNLRDDRFRQELLRRNAVLTAAIDAGDDAASIQAELDLHGLVYEASEHRLLQRTWHGLRGRLQLYWAAHHRAHGSRGPKRDSHETYVQAALGDDLALMLAEITNHMGRGAERTESFMRLANPFDPNPKTGVST